MNTFTKRTVVPLLLVMATRLCLTAAGKDDVMNSFEIVRDGQAQAVIIIAEKPSISAKLAAVELQYHLAQMTGVTLAIQDETTPVTTKCILVGESKKTRQLGFKVSDFKATEYMIKFLPDTLVLMGLDWVGPIDEKLGKQAFEGRTTINYNKAIGKETSPALQLTIPSLREEQGSCYAVYDFLERYCGVRWYGPSRINIIIPQKGMTYSVFGVSLRRFPSIKHRQLAGATWPTENYILSAKPSKEATSLYAKRIRDGGLRWFANHSALDGDWLVDEATGDALGFTDQRLVDKLVKAARAFFDGKGLPAFTKKSSCHAIAMGDYFAIVPNDSNLVRVTELDKQVYAKSASDTRGAGFFGHAQDSLYFFQLINKVARELRKTHPNRKIATLAYSQYSYKPKGLELEPNISVAPCLISCGYHEASLANDRRFYREWVDWSQQNGAELFIWGYFHSPYETGEMKRFNVFPLFVGDRIANDVQGYVQDNLTGVFLCGPPLQPDNYIYHRTAWDAQNADYATLIKEYFTLSFGKAGPAMQQFYTRVQEINKAEKNNVDHLPLEMSWNVLGTDARMKELGSYFDTASALAGSEEEKARVQLWRNAFWQRMLKGKEQYRQLVAKEDGRLATVAQWNRTAKQREERLINDKAAHSSIAKGFIPFVKVYASSRGQSPYNLVNGHCMDESTQGVWGTRAARVNQTKAEQCWYGVEAEGSWIKVDLQQNYELDELLIWNHPTKAMKNVRIEHSLTGRRGEWTVLDKRVLKSLDTITAGRALARYIRIVADGVQPTENTGLAQIRVYGEKE
jgi:hypothetical protein